MEDVLLRLYKQDLGEDDQNDTLPTAPTPTSITPNQGIESEELVGGLPLQRAILLAQGEIAIEDLTPEERESFEREVTAHLKSQVWEPWWEHSEEIRDIQLNERGVKLVAPIIIDEEEEEEDDDNNIGPPPPPPSAPLPALSTLTSKPPSSLLPMHLVDILFSYCLVMRLFNGQYAADIDDAVATLLEASAVLSTSTSAATTYSRAETISSVLLDSIIRVSGGGTGDKRSHVPPGFAIGIVSDVASVVKLGRVGVLIALNDVSRMVGVASSSPSPFSTRNSTGTRTRGGSRHEGKQRHVAKKIAFFLSWANEQDNDLWTVLYAGIQKVFEEQRSFLSSTESTTICIPHAKTHETSGASSAL